MLFLSSFKLKVLSDWDGRGPVTAATDHGTECGFLWCLRPQIGCSGWAFPCVWVTRTSHVEGWRGKDRRGEGRGGTVENRTFFRNWGDMGRGDPKGRHTKGRVCCALCSRTTRCWGSSQNGLAPLSQTHLNARSFNVLQAPTSGKRLTCSQQTSQGLQVRARVMSRNEGLGGITNGKQVSQRKGAAILSSGWLVPQRIVGSVGRRVWFYRKAQIQIFNVKISWFLIVGNKFRKKFNNAVCAKQNRFTGGFGPWPASLQTPV